MSQTNGKIWQGKRIATNPMLHTTSMNTDVRLYPISAVVTGRVTITKKDKDSKIVKRQSRFTDVFVWRDATWQLVAGHSSRIPETVANK
jgi:hypothetical protein